MKYLIPIILLLILTGCSEKTEDENLLYCENYMWWVAWVPKYVWEDEIWQTFYIFNWANNIYLKDQCTHINEIE